MRSEVTIDLGAVRHNARRLLEALEGAELWAVVKADAYGHGAPEVSKAALEAGAAALCVSTVGEGAALRSALPQARILVMGPCPEGDLERVRRDGLELAVSEPPFPMDVPVHLKLDTGMGRYGMVDVPAPPPNAVAVMSHLATADSDPAFAERQLERFREAADSMPQLEAHVANSAAALRLPAVTLLGRALRRCALRALAVRDGSGRGRPRAGALLAQRARAGEAAGRR